MPRWMPKVGLMLYPVNVLVCQISSPNPVWEKPFCLFLVTLFRNLKVFMWEKLDWQFVFPGFSKSKHKVKHGLLESGFNTSCMIMLFLLIQPTKLCYFDVTMHYIFCRRREVNTLWRKKRGTERGNGPSAPGYSACIVTSW